MGGIGKLLVDGLCHADGVIRAIEPEDVPSCSALNDAGNVLVKVFPLQPELTLVPVRFRRVIDAIEVELPYCAAIESGLNRDAISDFPMEAFCELCARHGALAILHKVIPLLVGHDKLRIYLAMVIHVDHELGKEILLILIDAAEPVIMRDSLHPGNRGDFVGVRNRHKVHQANAIDDNQAVSASKLDATVESAPHDRQKREENQGDGEGAYRQN